ncbi:uncharacterized protein BDV14DRAFT_173665 [Aspergillus stella-maris]|uniref:uncharacterized protein n=1 Tax=Aspergillus stella-maris TaxID=1810926 RepID=UPI003CCCE6CD
MNFRLVYYVAFLNYKTYNTTDEEMLSDEYCLYVALYVRHGNPTMPGKEDTYYCALPFGPKIKSPGKKGICYHEKEYREREVVVNGFGKVVNARSHLQKCCFSGLR